MARQTACLSNIKQISLGMMMYSEDWDGKFPVSVVTTWPGNADAVFCDWFSGLTPYVGNTQVFQCPSFMSGDGVTFPITGTSPIQYVKVDYLINGCCSHGESESLFSQPSSQIAFAERQSGYYDLDYHPFDAVINGVNEGMDPPPWNLTTAQYNNGSYVPGITTGTNAISSDRHNGGANYGFIDGHAKWMRWGQTYAPNAVPAINLHNTEGWTVMNL
jgi:prepilin-type processing-associated H-X9-DG protein